MVERHVGELTALDEAAVDPGDRSLPGHQTLQRVPSEDEHDFRLDQGQLLPEVWRTRLDLVRHRVAVHGRPALKNIRDVDIGAAERNASEQRVEQLARGTHEGFALAVLVEAGRLADDHDVGRTRPHPGHRLGARRVQAAVLAGPYDLVEREQLGGRAKRLSLQAWRT